MRCAVTEHHQKGPATNHGARSTGCPPAHPAAHWQHRNASPWSSTTKSSSRPSGRSVGSSRSSRPLSTRARKELIDPLYGSSHRLPKVRAPLLPARGVRGRQATLPLLALATHQPPQRTTHRRTRRHPAQPDLASRRAHARLRRHRGANSGYRRDFLLRTNRSHVRVVLGEPLLIAFVALRTALLRINATSALLGCAVESSRGATPTFPSSNCP